MFHKAKINQISKNQKRKKAEKPRINNTNYATYSPKNIIISSLESENDKTIIYYPKRKTYVNKNLIPSTNSNQFTYKDKNKLSEYIIKDNYNQKFITKRLKENPIRKNDKKLEKSESTPYIKSYSIINPFKNKSPILNNKSNRFNHYNCNSDFFSNVIITNNNLDNENLKSIKDFNYNQLDSPSHLNNNNNNKNYTNLNIINLNPYYNINNNNLNNNKNSNENLNLNSNLNISNKTLNNNLTNIKKDNNIIIRNENNNDNKYNNNNIYESPLTKSNIDDKSDFFTEMNIIEPNKNSPNIFINNTNTFSNEYCNCENVSENEIKIQSHNSFNSNTTQSFFSTKGKMYKYLSNKDIYHNSAKVIQSNYRGYISRKKFSIFINFYMNFNYAQIIFNNVLKRFYSKIFFNILNGQKDKNKTKKFPIIYQKKKSENKFKKNKETSFSIPRSQNSKTEKIYKENLYYKNQIEDYLKKLDKLKKDNLILKERNDLVKKEKCDLEKNRNEIIIENNNLKEKYRSLSIEKDNLNKKNNKILEENLKFEEENKNLLENNIKIKNYNNEILKERNELKEEKKKILNEKKILENDKNNIFKEYNSLNEKYNNLDYNIKRIKIENESLKEKKELEEKELNNNKEITKKMLIKIYLKDIIIKKAKLEKYYYLNILYKWHYISLLEKEKILYQEEKRNKSLKALFLEKEKSEKKIKKKKLSQFIYKSLQSENLKIKSEKLKEENIIKVKFIKNIILKIEKEKKSILHNYFLKYYFKILLDKKTEEKKIIEIPKLTKLDLTENKEDKTITDITSNESPGYKLNMNTDLARKKYLKDLFYNKIKEKKEYLHKCFIKLYYRGLYLEMKNKNKKNDISTFSNNDNSYLNNNSLLNKTTFDSNILNNNSLLNKTNVDNNNVLSKNNINNSVINSEKIFNDNTILNSERLINDNKINNESNNNSIKEKKDNLNNNLNNNNNENNENKKEIIIEIEEDSIKARREKAKNLRKILRNKEKEKKEELRKYFYKFLQAGIICSMKKEGKKRRTLKLQSRKETSKLTLNTFKLNNNNENNETQEPILKFDDDLEEDKISILNKKKSEKLENLFYKKNRMNKVKMKNYLQKWNLTSKLLKISNSHLMKKPKKKKVSSVSKKKNMKKNDSEDKLTIKEKSNEIKRKSNKRRSVMLNNKIPFNNNIDINNLENNNSIIKNDSEIMNDNEEYVDYQTEIKKHYLIGKLFKDKLNSNIAFFFHLWKNNIKKEKKLILKGNLFLKYINNFQRKVKLEKLRNKVNKWKNIINKDLKIDVTLRKFVEKIKIIFIERNIDKFLKGFKCHISSLLLKNFLIKKQEKKTLANIIIDLISKIQRSDEIIKKVLEKKYKKDLINFLKEKKGENQS